MIWTGAPAWSPDGMRIAAPSYIDTETPDDERDPDDVTDGSAIFAFTLDAQNQVTAQRRVLMSLGLIYDLTWLPFSNHVTTAFSPTAASSTAAGSHGSA